MIRNVEIAFNMDDLALSLRRTIEQSEDGDTILFPAGEHHIYSRFCQERVCWMSNNESGLRYVFCNITGKKDITVDGNGAKLIFHGRILPFFLESCENITLKNISFDYDRPFFSQGLVVENNEYSRLVLYMDPAKYPYRVENDHIVFEGNGWETSYMKWFIEMNSETKDLVPSAEPENIIGMRGINLKAKMIGKNLVEFIGSMRRRHKVGSTLVITHELRLNPGIVLSSCVNATVEHVIIYHAGAMGLIAQNCENTYVRFLELRLPEGTDRLLTAVNDATHFVSCRGEVVLEDCILRNQHDDGTNIHGAYSVIAPGSTQDMLLLEAGHFQQEGVPTFAPGDLLVTVNATSLAETGGQYRVRSFRKINRKTVMVHVEHLCGNGPVIGEVVEDKTAIPDVQIRRCKFMNNRGRGAMLSTDRTTIVENCYFSTPGAAIRHTSDACHWYESGPCKNLLIRNNVFEGCAYVTIFGKTAILFKSRITRTRDDGPYAQNIEICGNRFISHGERAAEGEWIDNIHIHDNVFEGDMPDDPFHFENSTNVVID